MRILQLIYEAPESPFGFGGAGVRACEIYRRLSGRHSVTLLSMKYPGARDSDREGLQYVFVGTETRSLSRSVLSYTLHAGSYVRKYGDTFDIIVENFLPSTPFFTRFLTKAPVVLQVQGIMERHSLKKFAPLYSLPMALVERFYPSLYERFIFVSGVTREKVMARKGGMKFCPVIPNGVNDELLHVPSAEGDYVLFLSRIDTYTKGLDLLVRAFERMSPEFPGIHLVLAGYEFNSFRDLVSGVAPSVREKIRYSGFVTGEDKVRLLSGAKFFVLPSRHESAPISILEAAACGKPVLVSDIPELHGVREKGFGISFRSGSVDDLAEKMRVMLRDESLRQRLGETGRAFARHFSWETIALQFEDALKQVIESAR